MSQLNLFSQRDTEKEKEKKSCDDNCQDLFALFFKIGFIGIQFIYTLCQFLLSRKVDQLHIYIYSLCFRVYSHIRSLESIEQSSLRYIVGSYQLPISSLVVPICLPQPPNLSLLPLGDRVCFLRFTILNNSQIYHPAGLTVVISLYKHPWYLSYITKS